MSATAHLDGEVKRSPIGQSALPKIIPVSFSLTLSLKNDRSHFVDGVFAPLGRRTVTTQTLCRYFDFILPLCPGESAAGGLITTTNSGTTYPR